jgi:translocation and assembly module TamA
MRWHPFPIDPRGGPRALALCALAALAVIAGPPGRAANPQPYKVTIAATGEAAIDQAVHDSATLISLHDTAPVGPFALVARARDDITRFNAALHSYGHYAETVRVTIDGHGVDDPMLPDLLEAVPKGTTVPVEVKLSPGPVFKLRHVTLTGEVPDDARVALGLAPGAPALAAAVMAARDRLLAALRDSGHALARVDEPVATLVPAAQALDVAFHADAGPRVDLGEIDITGLKRMREAFVRRRLLLHPGERYSPAAIAKAREDLASIGVFSTVRVTTGDALGPSGRLPVQVQVAERPLRTVNLGAAYSTDLGGSVTASWTHHNLFGNAETLALSASATELGGTAARQPGYNVGGVLTLPDWGHRDQSLAFNATALKEYLQAYDRTAYLAGTTLSRRLTPDLTASVGLEGEQAHIVQERVGRDYTLAQVPVGLSYDTTHNLLDATHGVRAALNITPTESFSQRNATFVIAQASASTYLDVFGDGRSVVAVRGLLGGVEGATTFDIPPDQRFYAGGGGTVRGFRFQSIGPQFPDGTPVGGTSVDVGSLELRQRFLSSYGAVAFVDAGQVGGDGVPFDGNVQVGAGVGARYYTSFGPIRLDVAVPVTKLQGGDSLEVYIGIGQAF